jgi:histidyl-tRNA synthetase
MESGCVTVKDMASGEQQVVAVADLVSKINC